MEKSYFTHPQKINIFKRELLWLVLCWNSKRSVGFEKMLKKEISTICDKTTAPPRGNGNVKKIRKEKCSELKRCFGFCDFLSTSWKLFKEFSADTSIHGIKYLTDPKRHWTEKLFWSIALSLSIAACSYLIYDSLIRCLQSPLLLSFSPRAMNIWQIPFAAITICPTGSLSPLNEKYSMYASTDSEIVPPLSNFTDSLETRITNLKFRNDPMKSSDFFTPIITSEGFCFTANMMNFQDLFLDGVKFEAFERLKNPKIPDTRWHLQEGYADSQKIFEFPHRVSGSGENGGIKFEIWRQIAEVKASTSYNKGFKLALHLPSEIPQFDRQYYRFPLEKSATLIIRPTMIVSEGLEGYSILHRKCYFEHEGKLKYFKKYTRSNCMIECLADYTRKTCNCIHFSMPRLVGDKMCDSLKTKCVENARKNFSLDNMRRSLETSKSYDDQGEISCNCLHPCTSLSYEGEISQDDIRYFNRNQMSYE